MSNIARIVVGFAVMFVCLPVIAAGFAFGCLWLSFLAGRTLAYRLLR